MGVPTAGTLGVGRPLDHLLFRPRGPGGGWGSSPPGTMQIRHGGRKLATSGEKPERPLSQPWFSNLSMSGVDCGHLQRCNSGANLFISLSSGPEGREQGICLNNIQGLHSWGRWRGHKHPLSNLSQSHRHRAQVLASLPIRGGPGWGPLAGLPVSHRLPGCPLPHG